MSFGVSFGGTVTRVLDGDTLDVEVRRTIRVRLLDCWAPEVHSKIASEKRLGMAAKAELEQLVLGKPVKVDVPIEGDAKFGEALSFGRVLGRVSLPGVQPNGNDLDVAAWLVGQGLAGATREALQALTPTRYDR